MHIKHCNIVRLPWLKAIWYLHTRLYFKKCVASPRHTPKTRGVYIHVYRYKKRSSGLGFRKDFMVLEEYISAVWFHIWLCCCENGSMAEWFTVCGRCVGDGGSIPHLFDLFGHGSLFYHYVFNIFWVYRPFKVIFDTIKKNNVVWYDTNSFFNFHAWYDSDNSF